MEHHYDIEHAIAYYHDGVDNGVERMLECDSFFELSKAYSLAMANLENLFASRTKGLVKDGRHATR